MGEKRLPYKAAIFDLDGTLLNTLEDLADSLNHVLTEAKMPMRTMDEVCRFVGNGIHKLIERAVPEGTAAETIEQLYQEFLKWYQFHCAEKTRPYEGIEALLKELKTKGVQTAVLSNKADGAVKSLCETYFPGMLQAEAGDRAGIKKKTSA